MDQAQVRELQLHIMNESSLDARLRAITDMLDRKVRQGKYDGKLAHKAYDGVVSDAAILYYVSPKPLYKASPAERRAALESFSKAARDEVSKNLARAYEAHARVRGLHIHDDRHLCHSCAAHEKKDLVEKVPHPREILARMTPEVGERVKTSRGHGTVTQILADGRVMVRYDRHPTKEYAETLKASW